MLKPRTGTDYAQYLQQMSLAEDIMNKEVAELVKKYEAEGYTCTRIHDEIICVKEKGNV